MAKLSLILAGSGGLVGAIVVVAIVLASGGAGGSSGAAAPVAPPTQVLGAAVSPTPTPTPPPSPTSTPVVLPSPLPDRTDCPSIRGSDYRSDAERLWFAANCGVAKQEATPAGAPAAAAIESSIPAPSVAASQPSATSTPTQSPATAPSPTLNIGWYKLVSQPPVVCDESAPVPPSSALEGLCIKFQILGVSDGPHQVHYDLNICNSGAASRTPTLSAASGEINSKLGIGKAGPRDAPLTGCDVTISLTVDGRSVGTRSVRLP